MRRTALVALAALAAVGACGNDDKATDAATANSGATTTKSAIEATVPTTASTLPSTITSPSWEHVYPNKTQATIVIRRVYTDNRGSGLEGDRVKDDPARDTTRVVVIAELSSPNALPTLDTTPLAVVNASNQKVYRDNPDADALGKQWGYCNGTTLEGPWNCVSADYFAGTAFVRGAIDVPVAEVPNLRVGWLVEPNGGCEPGVAQPIQYIPEGQSAPIEGCLYEVPLAK